jgi:hypothetical protein
MSTKTKIEDFQPKLQMLCAKTLADNRTREDASEIIEALLSALSFTISLACAGNPKAIDEMLHGSSAYLAERCADKRKAGEVMGFES